MKYFYSILIGVALSIATQSVIAQISTESGDNSIDQKNLIKTEFQIKSTDDKETKNYSIEELQLLQLQSINEKLANLEVIWSKK